MSIYQSNNLTSGLENKSDSTYEVKFILNSSNSRYNKFLRKGETMSSLNAIKIEQLGLPEDISKTLLKNGFTSLQELNSANFIQLSKLVNIGDKKIAKIKTITNFVYNNFGKDNVNVHWDLISNSSKDFLENFILISKNITELSGNKRFDFIDDNFGIYSGRVLNHIEIGIKYNHLSRERSSQIIDEIKSQINISLKKEALFYSLRIPKFFFEQFHIFNNFINQFNGFVSVEDIEQFLQSNFNIVSDCLTKHKIRFLFSVLGYEKIAKSRLKNLVLKEIWSNHIEENENQLIELLFSIKNILKEKIVAIDYDELIIGINKHLGREITGDEILNAFHFLNEAEIIDGNKYQLKFQYFSRTAEQAYRIIAEKNSKMHRMEILREFNHRLTLVWKKAISENTLRSALNGDSKIRAIRKSGYFTISNEYNTDSLITLIQEKLNKENIPLTFDEIMPYVLDKRPEAKSDSVRTILSFDEFLNENGKYSLASWEGVKRKRENTTKPDVQKLVLDYFVKNSISELEYKQFVELSAYELNISRNTIRNYISSNRFDFLTLEKRNSIKYVKFLGKEFYKGAYKNSEDEKARGIIINLLAGEKTMFLKDIIKTLAKKTELAKPTIYKLIDKLDKENVLRKINIDSKTVIKFVEAI